MERGVSLFFRGSFILLLFALMISSVSALNIKDLDDNYYYGDQIYFISCTDYLDNLNATISCLDPSKLQRERWSDGCYIFGFDTKDLDCYKVDIALKDPSYTLRRTIEVKDYLVTLVNHLQSTQISSDTDPLELAEMAHGYSLLEKYDRITEILEILKNQRDNDDKCWPSGTCNLQKTVDILYQLSEAGVNSSNRVYKDAILWVQAQQNLADADLIVNYYSNDNTSCIFYVNSASSKTFDIDEEEGNYTFNHTYVSGTNLSFYCDEDYSIDIINAFNEIIYFDDDNNDTNLSFEYTLGCWPQNVGFDCSTLVTSKVLLLDGLDTTSRTKGEDWLTAQLTDTKIKAKKLGTTQNLLRNIYAYNVTGNADVKTWIFYSQNNDGSWGEGNDQLHTTLVAIKAFTKENSEWVNDAVDWVLSYRSSENLNDTEDNSILYDLFKNEKPVIRADPLIPKATSEIIDFQLSTTLPVTGLNHNTSSALSVEATLSDNITENTDVKLMAIDLKDGIWNGFLHLESNLLNKSIPFVFWRAPAISFNYQPTYYVYDREGSIAISYTRSESLDNCTFSFNSIFEDRNAKLDGSAIDFSYVLDVAEDVNITKPVSIQYTCYSPVNQVEGTINFVFRYFSTFPIHVSPTELSIDSKPGNVKILNKLNETITIETSWLKDSDLYSVSPDYEIPIGMELVLPICQELPYENGPVPDSNVLTITALDYDVDVPINIVLNPTTHDLDKCQPSLRNPDMMKWVIIGLIAIFIMILLALILMKIWSMRFLLFKRKKSAETKESGADDGKDSKGKTGKHVKDKSESDPHPKGKHGHKDMDEGEEKLGDDQKHHKKQKPTVIRSTALAEILVALDRKMGESDNQIKDELKHEGYKKKEMKEAAKKLDELEHKMEEAEKKKEEEVKEANGANPEIKDANKKEDKK
ncbi:hypothetical protein H6503_02850 [Candidatus Woesearchaeota archaeon]|nr:hypothetical protein [Candidatus Woesearchaeota archaeon]